MTLTLQIASHVDSGQQLRRHRNKESADHLKVQSQPDNFKDKRKEGKRTYKRLFDLQKKILAGRNSMKTYAVHQFLSLLETNVPWQIRFLSGDDNCTHIMGTKPLSRRVLPPIYLSGRVTNLPLMYHRRYQICR
jgi:hypothetical protein